ncbi:MAG: hypothetical protein U0L20_05100 [Ruminococcus sp.]|nr:hypothetical protein [Ruminococcus sp.]
MEAEKILKILNDLEYYSDKIGGWKIALGVNTKEPLTIAYYYDEFYKKYIVYKTAQNLPVSIWREVDTEEQALEMVHKWVLIEYEARIDVHKKVGELRNRLIELGDHMLVNTGGYSRADFCMGYYYDSLDKLWKVYKNGERGVSRVRFASENKEDAFVEFYKMLEAHVRVLEM